MSSDEGVFYKLEEIPNADPATFEFLGGVGAIITWDGYAKDRNAVYFREKVIEGADSSSFHLMEPTRVGYAEDKNNRYAFGEKVENDFEFCSTDMSLLPEGADYWSEKFANIIVDTRGFEYCRSREGGTLVAFAGGDIKIRLFHWFDKNDNLVNKQPVEFVCGKKEDVPLSPQAIDKLENNKVSLFCTNSPGHQGYDPCTIIDIYELDLSTFKISPSDDYFDCGYRG